MLILFGVLFAIMNNYLSQDYKHTAAVSTIKEAVNVASVRDLNLRSRANPGDVLLSKNQFDQDVRRIFSSNCDIPFKQVNYHINYLMSSDNLLKAVNVQIDDGKNYYHTTFVSNVSD